MLALTLLLITVLSLSLPALAHTFTLQNQCEYNVPLFIDSWPGTVSYTGSPNLKLQPGQSTQITIPSGWNSRICHNYDCGNCWGDESMVEFNVRPLQLPRLSQPYGAVVLIWWLCGQMDAGGLAYYDISNIEGYTVPQEIIPSTGECATVTCTSATCPCDQAYPVGNEQGCGAVVDLPVKACASQDFTIIYCP
ncbi:Osmotin, thaumatin-like protein [Calocera viscosa TUFC12733]|uniref:Osmotin, thaumatin-like protein n=1 Tax=Calocera viscosa (strain TUFC12733) TaxID=1330018 RepID=A0A167NHU9_CALVF|nr:Osmotin, thaumatin-like protein [Calocera viscosa TUFC12733]